VPEGYLLEYALRNNATQFRKKLLLSRFFCGGLCFVREGGRRAVHTLELKAFKRELVSFNE
jgi:hypothetical protein